MQPNRVLLLLDKEWKLEDLAVVSKNYNQLYAFAYSLQTNLSAHNQQQVVTAYTNLPWRGGFSTVHFFTHVFSRIPASNQPRVTRITYASPGFIELAALASVCFIVARIVTTVAHSIKTANDVYSDIRKGMQMRKLSKLQANLKEAELLMQIHDFCEQSCEKLTRTMGISPHDDAVLNQRTQGNRLQKLKLLMSVYRRVAPLAEKQSKGMLNVQTPPPPASPPRDPLV